MPPLSDRSRRAPAWPAHSRSEQFQEHDVRHETALGVAADRLPDIETKQRSIWADGLSGDADPLKRLVVIAGEFIVQQPVVIERLEPELVGEDEPVRQMADDRLLRADGSRSDPVDSLRAEESELVLREPVETLPVGVIELRADPLKLRKIKTLGQRGAEVRERLLLRIVLGEDAPRLPRSTLVVFVVAGDRRSPTGVLRLE